MKKFLSTFFVVLALCAAGAAVYLYQKPGGRTAVAAASSAACVPAETLVFLSIPDPAQSLSDWKTTDLYKIWSEPEMQAFLAKPLAKIPESKEVSETLAKISKVDPRNLFVALASVDETSLRPHVVAGFEFKGSTADVDALLAQPKEMIRQAMPSGKADLVSYEGHTIETFDAGEGNMVASTFAGSWYLVGNDLALLKSTLDRIDRRAPATSGATLEKSADFQTVMAKMPAGYESLIYARPQSFLARVYDLAAASGQPISAEQRAQVEMLKAMSATTCIESGKLRDTVYVLAPGQKRSPEELKMSGVPLTSADTLLYLAAILQLPDKFELPATSSSSTDVVMAMLGQSLETLKQYDLKPEEFLAAFGREMSVQLDWPAGSLQPGLMLSLDVRDPAKAGKFVENLARALSSLVGGLQTSQVDGVAFHTLTNPSTSAASPTLALTDKHLLIGSSQASVRDGLAREKAGGQNVTSTEAYKASAAAVSKPSVATGYMDSPALFRRVYDTVKPVVMLGSALMFPQAGEYVDLGKLPATETIARHLSPTVWSESADEQGVLMESVGSVTFMQAGTGVVGAVGAFAGYTVVQKQAIPGLGGALPAVPDESETPAQSPAATAEPSPKQ